jgi:lysyl-tRNA synthetase class 2
MELNEQQQVRLEKANALRERGLDPYPNRSTRTHTAMEALKRFGQVEERLAEGYDTETISVAGRVQAMRDMGRSAFAHIQDASGVIQLYARRNVLPDESYEDFIRYVDLGDFIQASGRLFRTRTGEVTIEITEWRMLAKAISPPPEKWHGLKDTEQRYRQRYVDLFSDPAVRDVFVKRAGAVAAIRRFLDGQGFIEAETPTLQPNYGGALAKPFQTHYNALDQTFYLRIADELYLKRLIVGGFERVYEICKDFRNEGVDALHSPEFTMLEFYMAYADYETIMVLTEEMLTQVVLAVHGSPRLTYDGQEIDFTRPWKRVRLSDAIFEATGIDYEQVRDQATLYRLAREKGVDIPPDTVWPKIVDALMKAFVRPTITQPTFLIDYPVELSPLAKKSEADPRTVERFQLIVGGVELCNAYTELNDPMDQYARFQAQVQQRAAGDDETMPIDMDYVEALMYGMPPTGGFGMGIDRLAMLLTDKQSIREVILFPALRSRSATEAGSLA